MTDTLETGNQFPLAFEQEQLWFLDQVRSSAREYLVQLLKLTTGNVMQAARLAHRNRTDFYALLGRHHLEPASFKQEP